MKRAALLALVALASCSSKPGTTSSPPSEVPPQEGVSLAVDKNPDPNVVEIDLEARPADKSYVAGATTPVWTYNGSVPGPLIDAKVGDRLVVHFKNSLPEGTTIHWHGVRLPAAMDGSLAMQRTIAPGATFDYDFVLKDAGLFWFHPHVQADIQVQKGLHGTLRVRGADEPAVDQELLLVLDDVKLKSDGTLSEFLDDTSRMMGREGNTLLVNGITNATLRVKRGGAVRLRLVNVANGRFFNLHLPGMRFRVIGTDGGLVPKPYDTETLLMAPGERYDVLATFDGAAGSEIPLMNEPYERGHESGHAAPMTVAKVVLDTAEPLPARSLPDAFRPLERLADRPVDFPIVLDEAVRNGEIVFTINDAVFPDIPPLMVKRGDVRVLEVKNASEMDHPFHLHGFFFQVLASDGVPTQADALANKDTIIVRAKSSLKLVARFDEPGMWMYHCHILEHGELGMMAEIHVE